MAKRETVFVTAAEWQKRLAEYERMNAKTRHEFDRKKRLELSVEDLRDEIVGLVLSNYHGSDEECFQACHADGGPHPTTLRAWRDRVTYAPRANTMRKAALAVGYDLGWVRRGA